MEKNNSNILKKNNSNFLEVLQSQKILYMIIGSKDVNFLVLFGEFQARQHLKYM